MRPGAILRLLGSTIDPRRDVEKEAPRAFLFSKYAVEYLFRLVGFFILLCLVVGLTLSSCTDDPYLQTLPLVLAVAFFFYIAITTFGIPMFMLIAKISNTILRRVAGYMTVAVTLFLTIYSVEQSPIFSILETYVGKFFPAAYECTGQIIELDRVDPGGAATTAPKPSG